MSSSIDQRSSRRVFSTGGGRADSTLTILRDDDRTLGEIETWDTARLKRFVDSFSHGDIGRFLRKGVQAAFFEDCDSLTYRELYYKKAGRVSELQCANPRAKR